MLKLTSISVKSFDLNYLDIYWAIAPTYEDVNNYDFYVERSESQFGPFYDLVGPFRNKFTLRDTTVKGKHSFYRNFYYRVRVVNRDTLAETVYPEEGHGVNLTATPDLVALEMARQKRLKIKEFAGRTVWAFPKKVTGQRCSCVDKVTGRRLRSECLSCFDVGFVGGFNSPIQTSAIVVTPDEANTLTPFGRIETETTVGLFYNYPELFDGYMILEAENIRWRVGDRIRKFRKGRSLIWQQAPISRIPEGDIEYKVPLNLTPSEIEELVASPGRNYTNPHNIEAV